MKNFLLLPGLFDMGFVRLDRLAARLVAKRDMRKLSCEERSVVGSIRERIEGQIP